MADHIELDPSAASQVELKPDTFADYIVSAGLWAAGLSWLIPMMGLQMGLMHFVDPRRLEWIARIYTRGQVLLTGSKWRAVVHPDIDPNTPYIFVQNHVNHLDHCTLYAATPHFKQGVELKEHFSFPVYGHFMRKRGTVPVDKGSASDMRKLIERMRGELNKGNSLLVFPEGTRTMDGRLGRFEPGLFRIARTLRAPIVPVAVTGMYRVMRKGSYLIRPGYDVTVYCEKPLPTAELTIAEIPRLVDKVHQIISRRIDDYWNGVEADI